MVNAIIDQHVRSYRRSEMVVPSIAAHVVNIVAFHSVVLSECSIAVTLQSGFCSTGSISTQLEFFVEILQK